MAAISPASELVLPEQGWSDELPPLAELVALLGSIDEQDPEDEPDQGAAAAEPCAELEELVLSLAIELEVRDGQGRQPRVTGSTPTQWTETTVLPVFHRLTLHVTRSEHA